MPKYELMYIVGADVSDDKVPKIIGEVKTAIEENGGLIEKLTEPGRKKLAYPIEKLNTGYYVIVKFSAPAEKLISLEHKIRTNQAVVRHLILNMDEALVRMEKDLLLQAKLKAKRPTEQKPAPVAEPSKKKIEIDLDAEIEKALKSEDLK